uniref:Uncharacterized protein n=1 Tax=Trypanosoma congolense (strain IL3000) TaxID=1068625 RepID=G0UXZ9_TRYCI|nr:conserved hypothetical protein [Trypanosoma congolense IL3000]
MQKELFSHILSKVAGLSHRNVAAIPYGEWFHHYVQGLKAYRNKGDSEKGSSDFRAAGYNVDVALLSSVVSQKWTEVVLINDTRREVTQSTSPGEVAWWRKSAEAAWLSPANNFRRIELVTTSFLNEPLLAGKAIGSWTEAARQSGAATSQDAGNTRNQHSDKYDCHETLAVVVPFTCLFQLRSEAFPRALTTRGNDAAPEEARSLQERRARLSTLSSLHQLMQIQCCSGGRMRNVELVVWSPVHEFHAILHLPRVRPGLPKPIADHFTLERVCECDVTRCAYLAHYLTLTKKETPLVLLAPQTHQAALQQLAIMGNCISKRSSCKVEAQHQSRLKDASVHRKAVSSCSKLVRRMTTREENLRQMMVP